MIRKLRRRGFTLIELMIVVAIIGILAAIAIPNFIRFQARSKQGEVKANLKALFTAQRSYYQEKDAFVNTISDIGFNPERGNRYGYANGPLATTQIRSALLQVSATTDTSVEVDTFKFAQAVTRPVGTFTAATFSANGIADPGAPGVGGACPTCNFMGDASYVAACGNTDVAAPAGTPFNTYNDVTCP
jgi:type IV pilus assembly protein PilA